MNNQKKLIHNKHGGSALFMTLLVMFTMLTITLAVSDLVQNGLKMHRSQINSTKAYFAAEAGGEQILWEIRQDTLNPYIAPEPECLVDGTLEKICVDSPDQGSFNMCDVNCDNSSSEFATSSLSNGAYYGITHQYVGTSPNGTTTLTSWGTFLDVKRRVELRF